MLFENQSHPSQTPVKLYLYTCKKANSLILVAKLDGIFQKEDAGMGSHTGFIIKARVSSIANPRSIYRSLSLKKGWNQSIWASLWLPAGSEAQKNQKS